MVEVVPPIAVIGCTGFRLLFVERAFAGGSHLEEK
jgi:hypothetical protein